MSSGDAPRAEGAVGSIENDGALMGGICGRDAKALERLYDRYSPRVFAFCLRSLSDRSEAEELVLEIFWELWNRPDRYDAKRSNPWTYLMQVTRSRLVDRLRSLRAKSSKHPFSADPQQQLENQRQTQEQQPLDQLADGEAAAQLRSAIAALTQDQRQALEMAYFDAMSYSQVANALGQPLGTIKSRIRQALAQLRQILDLNDR